MHIFHRRYNGTSHGDSERRGLRILGYCCAQQRPAYYCINGIWLLQSAPEYSMSTCRAQFVYDQDCTFCRRFVEMLRHRCADRVTFVSSRNYEGIGSEWTDNSSVFVLHNPVRVCVGHAGIGELLQLTSSPILRIVGKLILTPVVSNICSFVYRWIASHRHWFRSGCHSSSGRCTLSSRND